MHQRDSVMEEWTENLLLQTPTRNFFSAHITMPLLVNYVLKVWSSMNRVKLVSLRGKVKYISKVFLYFYMVQWNFLERKHSENENKIVKISSKLMHHWLNNNKPFDFSVFRTTDNTGCKTNYNLHHNKHNNSGCSIYHNNHNNHYTWADNYHNPWTNDHRCCSPM